jgi:hypothetical protein
LSPFELPVQDIGLLPEPSTNPPKFPHRRLLKYLTEYSKRRPSTSNYHSDKLATITGDSVTGIESIVHEENKEQANESMVETPINRINGESKKSNSKVRHESKESDLSSMNDLIESVRRRESKIDKANDNKGRKGSKTFSIVNLFKASVHDESEANNETRSMDKEKPMQKNLPIKKLEDSNQKENELR